MGNYNKKFEFTLLERCLFVIYYFKITKQNRDLPTKCPLVALKGSVIQHGKTNWKTKAEKEKI